jgi:hypothetical protein
MTTPADVVEGAFAQAEQYASSAQQQMQQFTAALGAAIYVAPVVDITFTPIEAPTPEAPPVQPAALQTLESEFVWDEAGNIALSQPDALTLDTPTLTIDEFEETAPVADFPDAPTVTFGVAPTVPAVGDVTVPDAPTLETVDLPTYLTVSTVSFGGVDLHVEETPGAAPTLVLAAPTAFSYTPDAAYTSSLLTGMQALLVTRLAGGTGLDPTIEQALWDRARERELNTGLANEAQVARSSEALGFLLPAGVLAAQLREAQQNTFNKVAELQREIAIKQADLEQTNLKEAIQEGIALEGKLIDQALRLEQLAFDGAKALADNAVASYNSQVDKYKALVSAYSAYVETFRAIIQAENLKLEEYKAELEGERTKAEVNKSLVQQYQAQIEAELSKVKVYEAQVAAAQTLMQLERTKIEAAGEQVRAYVAAVNGETAKVEVYKAQVSTEQVKADIYRIKADAYRAKVGGQAEKSRAQLAYYEGRIRAYQAEWGAWSERVRGESSRFQALASKSGAIVDGYKASVMSMEAVANQNAKLFEAQIRQYDAQMNYSMMGQKINSEIVQANANRVLDATKMGAQVYSQLAASAYSSIQANASVQGSSGTSVSYSYSNQTSNKPSALTSI